MPGAQKVFAPAGQAAPTPEPDHNAIDPEDDMTELMRAVKCGDKRLIERELSEGADPRIKNSKGKTAASYAKKPEIARVLGIALKKFSREERKKNT